MSVFTSVLLSLLASETCWARMTAGRMAAVVSAQGRLQPAASFSQKQHAEFSQHQRAMFDKYKSFNAFELLDEVEKMLASGHADPDKIKIIKTLVVEQLIPTLMSTRDVSQDQVNARLLGISECENITKGRLDQIDRTSKKQVNVTRQDHRTCRTTQGEQAKDKITKCQFLTFLTSPAAKPANDEDTKAMLTYATDMQRYWCDKESQIQECNKVVDNLSSTIKSCSMKQRQFEVDFCTMAIQLKEACEHLSQECYETAKQAYDETVASTKQLVEKWKTEYSAMKKIACFVDVWLSDDNPDTADKAKLEECKKHNPDNSVMEVNYGTPAGQYQCKNVELRDFPGTDGFAVTEYGAFKDLVDEVVPCLDAAPQEATTVAPTPAPPVAVPPAPKSGGGGY